MDPLTSQPGGPSTTVLITAISLADRGGSTLYVRDLARELQALGLRPVVYSPVLGEVADELRSATITVLDDLSGLVDPPDVIHGNHTIETAEAVLRFPGVPAVFTCHGWDAWMAEPPVLSSVVHYIGVTNACRDRITIGHGIPDERCDVIPNGVDTVRFALRDEPLPEQPRRAVVFSNTAVEGPYLDAVRAACAARNIELDAIGRGLGRPEAYPEQLLADYDLVFARGRCALEAMSTGAATVLADEEGLGPVITLANVDALRMDGLGRRALTMPHDIDLLLEAIDAYDARDATEAAAHVRATASLSSMTAAIVDLYEAARQAAPEVDPEADRRWLLDHLPVWSRLGLERDEVLHARHVLAQHAESLTTRLHDTDAARASAVEAVTALQSALDTERNTASSDRAKLTRERDHHAAALDALASTRWFRLRRRLLEIPGARHLIRT